MAKCDLSIELDHPEKVYVGGDKITGTVFVDADADVKCKSLDVLSGWRTHGRGNVDSACVDTTSVFAGEWTAGQRKSYRFELAVGDWPPSYHGNLINIDHYIDARAKIPWAFDPKASHEFVVRPRSGPSDMPAKAHPVSGCVGIGLVVFVVGMVGFGLVAMAGGLIANPMVAAIAAMIILPIILLLTLRATLPKWLLGNVECELLASEVSPGGKIKAKLAFCPKRAVAINEITATVSGAEVCYSGSGSNRSRHANEFFNDQQTLMSTARLEAGVHKEFNLEFPLPDDVPYSFNFSDNNLVWNIAIRVDIPRWPDWKKALDIHVLPGVGEEFSVDHTGDVPGASLQTSEAGSSGEITFSETAGHLWDNREDRDNVDILVGAVIGLTFDIEAFIERRLLYSGREDPHVYRDGYAVWARYQEPPLPLVLYIPHELGDEIEHAGRELWKFRGTVVGWDHEHRRLQIKVLPGEDLPS